MFRSIVFRTLILSVLLHAGFAIFLWNDKGSGESVVSINVQYQPGDGEGSVDTDRRQRPAKLQAAELQGESASSGASSTTGLSAEVTGESLGLQAVYPKLSRVLGESGSVRIAIKGDQAFVSASSGFKRLDESALTRINEALRSGALKQVLAGRDSLLINFVFRLK